MQTALEKSGKSQKDTIMSTDVSIYNIIPAAVRCIAVEEMIFISDRIQQ